jgi:hypothetical protein
MKRICTIVWAAAVMAAVAPAAAQAAPPALVGVGETSRHLTAQWTLPPGVEARVLEAATSPQTSTDGYFFDENLREFETLEPGQTSYVGNEQLPPGTYFVHVAGYDDSCLECPVREWSAIATITIPAAGSPAPVATPTPTPEPASDPLPTRAPTLTQSTAKRYIRTALRDRFRSAYRSGSGKRINSCSRRSRVRIRCRVSWFTGDVSWSGRVTAWHEYLGKGDWLWDASGRILQLDEYCKFVRKARNCTKVIRF